MADIQITVPGEWAGTIHFTKPGKIEITPHKSVSREAREKALEMVDEMFKPYLSEGQKQCD